VGAWIENDFVGIISYKSGSEVNDFVASTIKMGE